MNLESTQINHSNSIVVKRPANVRTSPVKVYVLVPSRSVPGFAHTVTHIRKPGMDRWTCTCQHQNIVNVAIHRNCYHIKQARLEVEAQNNRKVYTVRFWQYGTGGYILKTFYAPNDIAAYMKGRQIAFQNNGTVPNVERGRKMKP